MNYEAKIINNNDFQVYLQPIVDTKTDRITSAEALIRPKSRWMHKTNAAQLINYAEKELLVDRIDKFVLANVCRIISNNRDVFGNITFHVNLSPIECDNKNIADEFKRIADQYQVPCSNIMLELLETKSMNMSRYGMLQKFKDYGFLIGIDDYGTGYSSVQRLLEFDFDCVKISKELYEKTFSSIRAKYIYNHIVSAIHEMKISIVQEGIETCSQYLAAKKHGIDLVQGYCISKAIPELEFCSIAEKSTDCEMKDRKIAG